MTTPSLDYKKSIGNYRLTSENLSELSDRWTSEVNRIYSLLKRLKSQESLLDKELSFLLNVKNDPKPLPIGRLQYHFRTTETEHHLKCLASALWTYLNRSPQQLSQNLCHLEIMVRYRKDLNQCLNGKGKVNCLDEVLISKRVLEDTFGIQSEIKQKNGHYYLLIEDGSVIDITFYSRTRKGRKLWYLNEQELFATLDKDRCW